MLHQISEEYQDSSQQLHTYIIKPLNDDSMIIYELTYLNGLIRINVFKYESIIKGFPKALIINYNALISVPRGLELIMERMRLVVSEEQSLSSRLNADSINYDFHLKEIRNSIVVQNKHFNVSQQILNVLSFYKTPPKFAKNYLNSVVLRIDLGFMDKISDTDFMSYFCKMHREYGFKVFTTPSSPQLSKSVIGGEENHVNHGNFAFFKEEGFKAKIDNFEYTNQSYLRRATSIISPF